MDNQLPPQHSMNDLLFDISAHLISDVIFLVSLFLIAWLMYYYTKRQKLYKFFCIKETKRLNVYLSRLNIIRGGALGVTGVPATFAGLTIVYNEAMAANKFRDNFNYISPTLSDKPGLLSKLLLSDVSVRSIISVANRNEIDNTTSLISLGSPTYNLVSAFIRDHNQNQVQFTGNGTAITINGLQPMANLNYGFIQRIHDRLNNRSYFYTAGISEVGTIGATDFLATHWNILFKKFKGDSNFIVVLDIDIANYENWNIVLERSW
jgi:hypothetical protein